MTWLSLASKRDRTERLGNVNKLTQVGPQERLLIKPMGQPELGAIENNGSWHLCFFEPKLLWPTQQAIGNAQSTPFISTDRVVAILNDHGVGSVSHVVLLVGDRVKRSAHHAGA